MTEKLQLKQSDMPAMGLREALRVAEALRISTPSSQPNP